MTDETTPELLGHDEAIAALCSCAATVTTLSYREAIEGYFKLRGLPIPTRPTPASEVTDAMVRAAHAAWIMALASDPDADDMEVIMTDGQAEDALRSALNAALMQSSSEQPPCSDRACLHGTGSEGAIPSTATDADAVKEIVSELARYYYLNDLQGRADDASIEVPVRLLRLAAFKETTDEQG